MNNFTEYRVKLRKINFAQQQRKECSAENRKHKKKNLCRILTAFWQKKVAKSAVRSNFLVYHLFAVRIKRPLLLCHKIVCRRPRRCPCLKCFHSGCKPDEKSDGPYHLTFPLQGSILRGSEIFGYDEKEYPERMLQRAAGWCKAVQGVRGKILSELSG